jgi:hypothetical protein
LDRGIQALLGLFKREGLTRPQGQEPEEIKSLLNEHVQTYLHMTASAPMGPGADLRAVVDENGKVRLVDGLYVGDASIMPDIPTLAINPTTICKDRRRSYPVTLLDSSPLLRSVVNAHCLDSAPADFSSSTGSW